MAIKKSDLYSSLWASCVELRGGNKLWYFGPPAGVVFNTDGGVYGYGGIYADVQWGPVVLTPQAGIGAHHQGESAGLGGRSVC